MATAPDNLIIWNAVCKTDPDVTKRVNQRGGFTAISAHSQIMEATRQFGPIGIGWGYDADAPLFHDNLVFVRVTLWHGSRDNRFGPVIGGAEWKTSKGFLDSDGPKKATTDALTKLLSQLGFNADVFLGLFDDNKYIEQVRAEFAARDAANDQPSGNVAGITKIKANLRILQTVGNTLVDLHSFNELLASNREDLGKIKDANHSWWTGDGEDFEGFKAWIVRRRAELAPAADDGQFAMLIQSMKQCETRLALTNWMDANEAIVGQLDGEESRRFQLAFELHESALLAEATVRS